MIVELPNSKWWVEVDEDQHPYCPCNIHIDAYLVSEAAFDFDTGKIEGIDEDSIIYKQPDFEKSLKLLEKAIISSWESM